MLKNVGKNQGWVVLVLAASILLTACSSSKGLKAELTPAPAAEKVTVRWLVVGEGTEPWMQSAENDFAANFNKSQDAIKLDLQFAIGGGAFNDRISAGDVPDLVGPITPNFSSRFIELWADIGSLMIDSTGLDVFEPATVEAWRREGKLIGIPFGYWPAVIFYNKDIFDRAGLPYPPHQYGENYALGRAWTLDTVAEIGPLMTLDGSGRDALTPGFDPNQAVQWGFVMEGNIRSSSAIFGTARILNSDGEIRLPQSWRDASQWMHRAIWDGMFFPNEAGFEKTKGDPFGLGAAAMYYAPTWFMCCQTRFNWDIAAVPSWSGKITSRREQSGFGIPQGSQNKEAAMKVIMAMNSDPGLISAFRIVPARTNLRKDLLTILSTRRPSVDWQVLIDSINYPDDPPYSEFLPRANGVYDRFSHFANGLLTNPKFDVDAELDQLEQDLQEIIKQ